MTPALEPGLFGQLRRWRPGSLARNSGYALFWQVIRAACLALYLWLLTGMLSAAQYGLLVAILSLASIAGTLNGGGVGVLLLRQGVRDPGLATVAWKKSCAAILAGFPLCFALYALALRTLVPLQVEYSTWVPLGVSEIALGAISGASASALQSREKLGWSGALLALPALGRLLAVVILASVVEVPTLSAYALLHLLSALIVAAVALSLQPWSWSRRVLAGVPDAWRWWWQGSGYAAMYLVALAAVDLDKSLVLKNSDAATAGYYSLGYRVVMTFALPVAALVQALIPRLIKQISESTGHPERLTLISAAAVLVYSTLAWLFLATFGASLVGLFGPAYASLATAIPGFCLLLVIYNLRCVAGALLYAENRPWSRCAIEGGAIVLVVVCSSILVPRYGLSGALATAVTSEVWIFLFSWILAIHLLRGKGRRQ